MKVELIRIEQDAVATRGLLLIDGFIRFVTLELPWRQNEKNISCIPNGVYRCVKEFSPKLNALTFELKGVPDRDEIKFHDGVSVAHTDGCILLGSRFDMKGRNIGGGGRKALLDLVKVKEFELHISQVIKTF